MCYFEKTLICGFAIVIALTLFLTCTKSSFAQRYQDGSVAIQGSYMPFFNMDQGYRGKPFFAGSAELVFYKANYQRVTAGVFVSKKEVETEFYKSTMQDTIFTYGRGWCLVATRNNFFNVFLDLGGLIGYEAVENYNTVNENIKSPFKHGLVFGAYLQVNAEVAITDFLVLFARGQFSWNGPIIHEKWPFYQGAGIRAVFN